MSPRPHRTSFRWGRGGFARVPPFRRSHQPLAPPGYSTCLFCNAWLGANQAIGAFSVGRQLAFDAVRGRLWVVCGKCERREKPVHKLAYPVRLAMEMAAHEEAERRALEGKLAALKRCRREAEEVAGISDSLLLPAEVEERLERLRRDA